MTIDPLWSSEDISTIVANIIQSIRLIPNWVTKKAPFEANFGRKPNTALSNIVTKANRQNLLFTKIKNFASDRKLLKQPVLTPAAMWNMEQVPETELKVQYKEPTQKDPHSDNHVSTESEDFEKDNAHSGQDNTIKTRNHIRW